MILRKYGLVERTDVIAFSHEYGLEFIKQLPVTKVFHLNGDLTPAQLKAEGYAGLDYSVKVMKKNPQWVNEAHELGLEVNVWTVNSKEGMEYVISLGVDYITTDEPELLQSVLRQ